MKRYTRLENVVSFLLGVAIGLPIAVSAHDATVKETEIQVETTAPTAGVIKELSFDTEAIKTNLGEFTVTAYCACEECCPGTSDGITYTETVATEGRTIAVDPDVIPLGSLVEISDHYYKAEDIGGAIKGDKIDIYFNSHADALEYGIQEHNIFLVEFPKIRTEG